MDFRPDELKIYPCSLINDTPLVSIHRQGKWQPYTHEELLTVITACLTHTPEYCRLTRIVRDIPSTDILVGNKFTNFRQIAENQLTKLGQKCHDIRAREIKSKPVSLSDLTLKTFCYETSVSQEYFLQFVTSTNQIAGFLRLSLPTINNYQKELQNCAIIREVHVYGQSLKLGNTKSGAAQHLGLGKKLIKQAEKYALEAGFNKLAVISAIGTREYYQKLDFRLDNLYQIKYLKPNH
jgi:elongator complex protein 3